MTRAPDAQQPAGFPLWAKLTIGVLSVVAIALVLGSILLLSHVRLPFLPSLGATAELSVADCVAILVGGLTTFLAIATVVLAGYTREAVTAGLAEATLARQMQENAQDQLELSRMQLKATQDQADAARDAIEASYRPIMVNPPTETAQVQSVGSAKDAPLLMTVPFRNAGMGLAIISVCRLEGNSQGIPGQIDETIVAPNEQTLASFPIVTDPLDPKYDATANLLEAVNEGGPVVAWVFYTDHSGHQQWRSAAELHYLDISKDGTRTFRFRQVSLYHGDDMEPYAISGPSGK
jgi:hypothetical protein